MSGCSVALVVPPFIPLHSAALGVSLLKGRLNELQIPSRVFYLNIDYGKEIGLDTYNRIASGEPSRVDLVGEWIFTSALYGSFELDENGYFSDILEGRSPHHSPSKYESAAERRERNALVRRLRCAAPDFIERSAELILSSNPKIVGFTSIFHSHIAGLALAKAVKKLDPTIKTLMGGSNCDGEMGAATARSFQVLDAVVSGEADEIFGELITCLLSGEGIHHIPGVHCYSEVKTGLGASPVSAPAVRDLNTLPRPDQTEYFSSIEASNLDFSSAERPHIAFEASRGCWWGEKHHCTFCGLNGSTIKFRSKTAKRAFDELKELVQSHPKYQVAVSDCIMDHLYHGEFFDRLLTERLNVRLFFEVKSNLRRDQIRKMRRAGITRVQPGIESFSDDVLQLMKKGVTGLQNIQTMKWCREFGVKTAWGLIWGFPGEKPEDYHEMEQLVPKLVHLQAPEGMTQIRLDRFSPNYNYPEQFGFKRVEPFPAYKYVFPFEDDVVRQLAYFFTYEYAEERDPSEYVSGLVEKLREWQRDEGKFTCCYFDKGQDGLLLFDSRPFAERPFLFFAGLQAEIIRQCDSIQTVVGLRQRLYQKSCVPDEFDRYLEDLQKLGLLLVKNEKVLSLPIRVGAYAPPPQVVDDLIARLRSDKLQSFAQFIRLKDSSTQIEQLGA